MYIFVNLSIHFLSVLSKKGFQMGHFQESRSAEMQIFLPSAPTMGGPQVDTRCQLTYQQKNYIRP